MIDSIATLVGRLTDLLPRRERIRWLVVLAASGIAAFFETMGVASVLPFMAVLVDPAWIDRYSFVRNVADLAGLSSPNERVVALGGLVGLTLVASSLSAYLALWSQQREAARTQSRLSSELFAAFIHQPYGFHIENDTPALSNILYTDVPAFGRFVTALMQLVSRGCVIVALSSLLVIQSARVAITVIVVLGICYSALYAGIRKRQAKMGREVALAHESRHRAAQEGLSGVKELQVLGREEFAINRFSRETQTIAAAAATSVVLAGTPRFILEPIAFGGVLAVALHSFLTSPSGASAAIPTLALYAFVGYRLLPAAQQMYASLMDARYSATSVARLHNAYLRTRIKETIPEVPSGDVASVQPPEILRLEGITFTYAGASRAALHGVSFSIRHGESIGLVGKSGSGKTTLADVILGLHIAQHGLVRTSHGVLTSKNVREWRGRVGYVPQHVFLSNATIRENIAFGLSSESIEHAAVEKAAQLAQASEFISKLPRGYDTIIGERGVALSGGQRQRLGIARALLTDPELLVFDEATSALDGETETAVMGAINALKGSRTVVIIAHRLQTIRDCDRIVVLDRGSVEFQGSLEDALAKSTYFAVHRPEPVSPSEQGSVDKG